MKSLNCWFKSKEDKSMFQERIPVKEKKREGSRQSHLVGLPRALSSSWKRSGEEGNTSKEGS